MKGKNYYYSCVQPEESDTQAERFRALGARDGEIFIDTIGEKSSQRNSLRLLKQLALREGDTLTISSLYCLSDLKKELADELHWLRDNGICLRIADETDAAGRAGRGNVAGPVRLLCQDRRRAVHAP